MSLDIYLAGPETVLVEKFSSNYTHNVVPMWKLAGVYDALYMSAGKRAKDILPALRAGLFNMKHNGEKYKALNPENGWGSYETAVPWLEKFIVACEENPESIIEVSK